MNRRNNFDALRLLGALMVLISHMAPLSGRQEWAWVGRHSLGNLGVLIFFSISGYLVSASWRSDPDLGRFLSRRYLRMFPGLLVMFAATYAIMHLIGKPAYASNHSSQINGSLWTLPFEIYCYLLLAAIGMVLPRPAVVLAIGMVFGYWLLDPDYLTYFGLFFAAGALLQAYPGFRSGWLAAVLVLVAALWFGLGYTVIALALAMPALGLGDGRKSCGDLQSGVSLGEIRGGMYI
jgi:peptidoglycan/LPS O-acetylase OafA/YrhL